MTSTSSSSIAPSSEELNTLAISVRYNLQYQHLWADITIHTEISENEHVVRLSRPLLSGKPPQRIYIHPDDVLLSAEEQAKRSGDGREWVLPTSLLEKWSIKKFSSIFDAIPSQKQFADRPKRLLLATVSDDSTVVYYIVHDGIVKPRQN
jgi:tRNA-splicing endonuclease subunit Sen15